MHEKFPSKAIFSILSSPLYWKSTKVQNKKNFAKSAITEEPNEIYIYIIDREREELLCLI